MAEKRRIHSLEELPAHLLEDILSKEKLSAIDLVSLEASYYKFWASYGNGHGFVTYRGGLKSTHSCLANRMFLAMLLDLQTELVNRCRGNWKLFLRFLQSMHQAFTSMDTPKDNLILSKHFGFTFYFSITL